MVDVQVFFKENVESEENSSCLIHTQLGLKLMLAEKKERKKPKGNQIKHKTRDRKKNKIRM